MQKKQDAGLRKEIYMIETFKICFIKHSKKYFINKGLQRDIGIELFFACTVMANASYPRQNIKGQINPLSLFHLGALVTIRGEQVCQADMPCSAATTTCQLGLGSAYLASTLV